MNFKSRRQYRIPTGNNSVNGDAIGNDYVSWESGIHPLVKGSISSVINHFKGNVKRQCNKDGWSFAWQSRFYDRILRSEKSLYLVQKYIVDNPVRWERDRNNRINIGQGRAAARPHRINTE